MLRFRKTWEIIGWAYDADLHCLACTAKRFGHLETADDDRMVDSEGNLASPVFLGDEPGDSGDYCGDCFTNLRED